MRIADKIQNITGSFALYMDRTNTRINNVNNYADNNASAKAEIVVRAAVSGVKSKSLVIEKLKFSDIIAQYSVHKATNRIIIKLYNQRDGKLIREIPAVKVLDMAANIMENAGVMLDTRV